MSSKHTIVTNCCDCVGTNHNYTIYNFKKENKYSIFNKQPLLYNNGSLSIVNVINKLSSQYDKLLISYFNRFNDTNNSVILNNTTSDATKVNYDVYECQLIENYTQDLTDIGHVDQKPTVKINTTPAHPPIKMNNSQIHNTNVKDVDIKPNVNESTDVIKVNNAPSVTPIVENEYKCVNLNSIFDLWYCILFYQKFVVSKFDTLRIGNIDDLLIGIQNIINEYNINIHKSMIIATPYEITNDAFISSDQTKHIIIMFGLDYVVLDLSKEFISNIGCHNTVYINHIINNFEMYLLRMLVNQHYSPTDVTYDTIMSSHLATNEHLLNIGCISLTTINSWLDCLVLDTSDALKCLLWQVKFFRSTIRCWSSDKKLLDTVNLNLEPKYYDEYINNLITMLHINASLNNRIDYTNLNANNDILCNTINAFKMFMHKIKGFQIHDTKNIFSHNSCLFTAFYNSCGNTNNALNYEMYRKHVEQINDFNQGNFDDVLIKALNDLNIKIPLIIIRLTSLNDLVRLHNLDDINNFDPHKHTVVVYTVGHYVTIKLGRQPGETVKQFSDLFCRSTNELLNYLVNTQSAHNMCNAIMHNMNAWKDSNCYPVVNLKLGNYETKEKSKLSEVDLVDSVKHEPSQNNESYYDKYKVMDFNQLSSDHNKHLIIYSHTKSFANLINNIINLNLHEYCIILTNHLDFISMCKVIGERLKVFSQIIVMDKKFKSIEGGYSESVFTPIQLNVNAEINYGFRDIPIPFNFASVIIAPLILDINCLVSTYTPINTLVDYECPDNLIANAYFKTCTYTTFAEENLLVKMKSRHKFSITNHKINAYVITNPLILDLHNKGITSKIYCSTRTLFNVCNSPKIKHFINSTKPETYILIHIPVYNAENRIKYYGELIDNILMCFADYKIIVYNENYTGDIKLKYDKLEHIIQHASKVTSLTGKVINLSGYSLALFGKLVKIALPFNDSNVIYNLLLNNIIFISYPIDFDEYVLVFYIDHFTFKKNMCTNSQWLNNKEKHFQTINIAILNAISNQSSTLSKYGIQLETIKNNINKYPNCVDLVKTIFNKSVNKKIIKYENLIDKLHNALSDVLFNKSIINYSSKFEMGRCIIQIDSDRIIHNPVTSNNCVYYCLFKSLNSKFYNNINDMMNNINYPVLTVDNIEAMLLYIGINYVLHYDNCGDNVTVANFVLHNRPCVMLRITQNQDSMHCMLIDVVKYHLKSDLIVTTSVIVSRLLVSEQHLLTPSRLIFNENNIDILNSARNLFVKNTVDEYASINFKNVNDINARLGLANYTSLCKNMRSRFDILISFEYNKFVVIVNKDEHSISSGEIILMTTTTDIVPCIVIADSMYTFIYPLHEISGTPLCIVNLRYNIIKTMFKLNRSAPSELIEGTTDLCNQNYESANHSYKTIIHPTNFTNKHIIYISTYDNRKHHTKSGSKTLRTCHLMDCYKNAKMIILRCKKAIKMIDFVPTHDKPLNRMTLSNGDIQYVIECIDYQTFDVVNIIAKSSRAYYDTQGMNLVSFRPFNKYLTTLIMRYCVEFNSGVKLNEKHKFSGELNVKAYLKKFPEFKEELEELFDGDIHISPIKTNMSIMLLNVSSIIPKNINFIQTNIENTFVNLHTGHVFSKSQLNNETSICTLSNDLDINTCRYASCQAKNCYIKINNATDRYDVNYVNSLEHLNYYIGANDKNYNCNKYITMVCNLGLNTARFLNENIVVKLNLNITLGINTKAIYDVILSFERFMMLKLITLPSNFNDNNLYAIVPNSTLIDNLLVLINILNEEFLSRKIETTVIMDYDTLINTYNISSDDIVELRLRKNCKYTVLKGLKPMKHVNPTAYTMYSNNFKINDNTFVNFKFNDYITFSKAIGGKSSYNEINNIWSQQITYTNPNLNSKDIENLHWNYVNKLAPAYTSSSNAWGLFNAQRASILHKVPCTSMIEALNVYDCSTAQSDALVLNENVADEIIADFYPYIRPQYECIKSSGLTFITDDLTTDIINTWINTDYTDVVNIKLPTGHKESYTTREMVTGTVKRGVACYTSFPLMNRLVIHPAFDEINAISNRVYNKEVLRKYTPDVKNEVYKFTRIYFVENFNEISNGFKKNPVTYNHRATTEWLLKKPNLPARVKKLVEAMSGYLNVHPLHNVNIHVKHESILKSKFAARLDGVDSRTIMAQSYAVGAIFSPIFLEIKKRFKSVLKQNMIYADGLRADQLAARLRFVKNVSHIYEADISKQDKRTDKFFHDVTYQIYILLGLDIRVIKLYTLIHTIWRWNAKYAKGWMECMRTTGEPTTAIGNVIMNMIIHMDLLDTNMSILLIALFLGDDSNFSFSKKPNVDNLIQNMRDYYNVSIEYTLNEKTGVFLRQLVGVGRDNHLTLTPDYVRLSLKYECCSSSILKQPESAITRCLSYLCMIGKNDDTDAINEMHGNCVELFNWYPQTDAIENAMNYYNMSYYEVMNKYNHLIQMLKNPMPEVKNFTIFNSDIKYGLKPDNASVVHK